MYKVNEIFYSIQGEGPFVGYPAVFLRLAGCNLTCPFCDTHHQKVTEELNVRQIVDKIQTLAQGKTKLIVITGGEPFLQPIGWLVVELKRIGWSIQIETNGTLLPTGKPFPWSKVNVVVSPKDSTIPALAAWATAIKIVLKKFEYPSLSVINMAFIHQIPVYIQPMDEQDEVKNEANINWCRGLCLDRGYRLSLQVQKIINVR